MNHEFTDVEKRLLLIFFAISAGFQRRVMGLPDTVDGWNMVTELPQRLLWKAIHTVLSQTKTYGPIPVEMIQTALSNDQDAMQALGAGNIAVSGELNVVLTGIRNYDLSRVETHLKFPLEVFQRFCEVRLALAKAAQMEAPSLTEGIRNLQTVNSLYRTSRIQPTNFMRPDAPLPDISFNRVPFGIKWLDDLCGGGMADGDAMLFIAPSGGGKSVFGTQLSWQRAMQLRHSVYCTYEQNIHGDIMTRYFAMATRIPKDVFKDVDLNNLPDEIAIGEGGRRQVFRREQILTAIHHARQLAGNYIHTYDMSEGQQGTGGVDDFREIVDVQTREGTRPTMIVVDWVETAVRNYMGARQLPVTELTMQMEQFAKDFAQFCRAERIQGVMLQQMDTENQSKKNVEPHHTLAARCKSLGNYCRVALGVTRLDEEGYGRLHRTKATSVATQNAVLNVRLNGPLNEFEASTDRVWDTASGRYVTPSGNTGLGAPPAAMAVSA